MKHKSEKRVRRVLTDNKVTKGCRPILILWMLVRFDGSNS